MSESKSEFSPEYEAEIATTFEADFQSVLESENLPAHLVELQQGLKSLCLFWYRKGYMKHDELSSEAFVEGMAGAIVSNGLGEAFLKSDN
jgi:hypothetical protein